MRLAFKNRFSFGYSLKEVEITLNIATLEALCEDNELEFYDIGNDKKITPYDFMTELLYHGYITACKNKYKKPGYTKTQAIIWNENLSQTARKELQVKINELVGKTTKLTSKKKVEVS